MAKPVTPLVGCDTFIVNSRGQVMLIQRADNGFWALPGGFVDEGESPMQCAARECLEETGLTVRITRLLGVFSSCCYKHENYPHRNQAYCHVLFMGQITAGEPRSTDEARQVAWFDPDKLPPMSDGHLPRVIVGFRAIQDAAAPAHFE